MKKIILLMLCVIALTATAQSPTEAQKQEALKCATDFCSLLTRFSNGERTLNAQINALCSGADCSAFDDIKTDKEVTLRNYLLAIQGMYPTKLPMNISTPTLANSETYIEPVVNLSQAWGSIDGNMYSTAEVTSFSLAGIENFYIVFNVRQNYPSLNKSTNRKLIYDVKNKKITAFIIGLGSYMSFMNSLNAFINKNYKSAIEYANAAIQNSRSALKERCYSIAWMSAIYSLDLQKAAYYSDLLGDKMISALSNLVYLTNSDQIEKAVPYVKQLEAIMEKDNDLNNSEKSYIYGLLGSTYAVPQYPEHNLSKASSYIEKAADLGNLQASFAIFLWYNIYGEVFTNVDAAMYGLINSAEGGYPPSFYYYGVVMENTESPAAARPWYEKSAEADNYIGMACLGRVLINTGDKTNGVKWLKKALTCPNLDEKIEMEGYGNWPKSRADVEALLKQYEYATPAPATTPSATSHTSQTTTSSSSNYSNYTYTPKHKFNEAKDNFHVGLSVGYVRKQWVYDIGNEKIKGDMLGDDGYTDGIQAGLRVDCQFGYGFGMNSGLFYEYYHDKSLMEDHEDFNYYLKAREHSLYMPVHFKYNLNFSRWFQLGFYGGIGFDYGLSGKYSVYSNEDLIDEDGNEYSKGEDIVNGSIYDDEFDFKRFNASLEYGASIRIRRLQINFTMARGLINMSKSKEYTVKQNKAMSISATLCF